MSQWELSKFLSYVLRHRPDAIGIELDEEGFTDAKVLLAKMAERHPGFAMPDLEAIVRDDDKGRYTLRDGRIRANQGHSIAGVTAFETTPKTPPDALYHGTSTQNWKRIREAGGLQCMKRHHVHLSPDEETAKRVGARRKGEVILLCVNAQRMSEDGYDFFLSDNGVWLVDEVPIDYLGEL